MSKKNYIAEAERQLSNQKHYATLDTPVYPQAAVRISATLDKLRRTGYISKKQHEYLTPLNHVYFTYYPRFIKLKISGLNLKCLQDDRL